MDVLAALMLQVEWGADEALEETAIDRMAPASAGAGAPPEKTSAGLGVPWAPGRASAPEAARRMEPSGVGPTPSRAGRPALVTQAQALADAAATPEAVRQALLGFTACPLAATATTLVFADGNPSAGLVLVGEAPGAEEDLAGRPFVGQSGKLLDRMLASINLTRERDFLITNLIPWRPPGNRPPTDVELAACLPFLLRHLGLLRPRLIVSLGSLSTRMLTGRMEGVRRLRGYWQNVMIAGVSESIPVLPMLHPAYLLRTPGAKKDAWQDLIALRRRIDETRKV